MIIGPFIMQVSKVGTRFDSTPISSIKDASCVKETEKTKREKILHSLPMLSIYKKESKEKE